ncbi:MAG: AMP-binding protein [Sphingobium sp.]
MKNDAYADIRLHGLGDVLREHRRSRRSMPALVDGEQRLDFAALDGQVNRIATALRQRGISAGDRIMWLGQNSSKVVILLLAAAKIGAVLCPANWRMTTSEMADAIADFDPKLLFWQEGETGEVHRACRAAAGGARIWLQQDGTCEDSYDALLRAGRDEDDDARVDPDLPVLAIYTAAHSGRAGAALLSHSGLLLQGFLSAQGQAIDDRTRYLAAGPMFHIGVMVGLFATFLSGGCSVIVARAQADTMARLIHEERATHGFVAQPLLADMAAAARANGYDLSSMFGQPDLSDWVSPAVMPPHAPQRARMGGYGQTELTGSVLERRFGGAGAGRPNMFTQVKLLDDAGNEAPDGATGEIAVRGPLVMCGYLGRPEENAARSRSGWHRTSDLGVRGEDGSIAFVGPKMTMIKTGVENVYPIEVEACILQHEAVEQVCVIGVPDPKWDQNVKAVVVLKADAIATADDIVQHCRDRISSFKKPKIVAFADRLPRLASGALDRASVDAEHGGGGYPSAR